MSPWYRQLHENLTFAEQKRSFLGILWKSKRKRKKKYEEEYKKTHDHEHHERQDQDLEQNTRAKTKIQQRIKASLSKIEKSGGARRTTMVQGRVDKILSMAARFLGKE